MLTVSNAGLISGRYRLGECVGRGGMGSVHRAIDITTGAEVALKQLRRDQAQRDPTSVERFRREGDALARLNHPNVVRVLELVHETDDDFIVMEYVAGGSLADQLDRRDEPLPIERALQVALDLCDALARCHRLGIVHRDLKPSNILLTEDGTPKLTDFGVAYVQAERRLTHSSTLVGTAEYLSPEALRGDEVDPRADIWALGIVLFEMLTLRRPFAADNVAQTLHSISFSAPPDLGELRPGCPVGLVELVYAMLAKDRTQRVASARKVSAAIEEILRGESHPTVRAPPPLVESSTNVAAFPNNLPAVSSTFVGRKAELADLSATVSTPGTRLVTIVGQGGMGKTRLALELAQQLVMDASRALPHARPAWFADGVFFIQLAALASSEFIVSAIAEVLGLASFPGEKPERQLFEQLREKRILLILDNFEHLLDGAELVSRLLAAASGVKVLCTSRERLGLSVETVFPLAGLDFPDASGGEQALDFSAVRLFVQCARQQRPSFALDADSAMEAARICRLVEGVPLGIVLSASWAGSLSPGEIAHELDQGLDFLATEWRDIPERQRSMRAVFEHSWQLLDANLREVLSALSVFRGGFTREAAQAVADANLRSIAALIDKCLLRRNPESGRFEAHELLRQYAERKLAEVPERQRAVLTRHASFFTRCLEARERELKGPSPARALAELELELDNLRAAWAHLVAERQTSEIARTIEALNVFHTRRASFFEAESTFSALAESLKSQSWPEPQLTRRLLGYALALSGMFLRAQGLYARAGVALEEASSLLDPQQFPREAAFALVTQGSNLAMVGKLEQGIVSAEEARRLYRSTDDAWGRANALETLGRLHANTGDLARAVDAYRESVSVQREAGLLQSGLMGLAIALVQQGSYADGSALMLDALATFEKAGDRWNAMRCRMHLANTRRNLGDYAAAEELARQCLEFCREVGNRDHEVWALFQLGNIMKEQQRYEEAEAQFQAAFQRSLRAGEVGKVALANLEFGDLALIRGSYAAARGYLDESLQGFERAGQTWGSALALDVRGFLACKEGDLEQAEQLLRRSLELALQLRLFPFAANTVAGLAWVRAAAGDRIEAVELLSLVQHHAATERHTLTRRVLPLLSELDRALPRPEFSAAVERGKKRELAEPTQPRSN
ncbi:MAG: protein kinase domain-containing protein [Myxococcota bacterium]